MNFQFSFSGKDGNDLVKEMKSYVCVSCRMDCHLCDPPCRFCGKNGADNLCQSQLKNLSPFVVFAVMEKPLADN